MSTAPRPTRPQGRTSRAIALTAASTLLVSLAAASAQAAPPEAQRRGEADGGDTVRVVATGLNNPRQLSFTSNGDLYVAESGVADPAAADGPCVESEEFGLQCLDDSGSVTLLSRKGEQRRVLTGLPAVVSAEEAVGPSDVVVQGQRAHIAFGLGGTVAKREQFGADAALLGTLTEMPLRGQGRSPRVLADLAAHEESDPDGDGVDSNPVDVVRSGSGWLVTDAGGNTVVRGDRRGTSTVAVLPKGMAEAPPFLGLPPGTMIPVQSVPTATAQGPDGAWYVAELTGFPFPQGGASVWRLDGDGTPQRWATGLTTLTDLAWSDGELYAVQLSDEGLLAGMTGSLVRVDPGGDHETVAGPLFAPYGVAVRGGAAYVTTCSVCSGGGEVVRVALP